MSKCSMEQAEGNSLQGHGSNAEEVGNRLFSEVLASGWSPVKDSLNNREQASGGISSSDRTAGCDPGTSSTPAAASLEQDRRHPSPVEDGSKKLPHIIWYDSAQAAAAAVKAPHSIGENLPDMEDRSPKPWEKYVAHDRDMQY